MSNGSNPEAKPPRGLVGDIHRARHGATATAAELREFVNQLRGRSPQEMLGIVAGSSLIRATVLASVITIVFMVGFTVGPYVWKQWYPRETAKAAPAPAAAAPAAAPAAAAPAAAAQGNATAAPAAASTSVTGQPTPDAVGRLGIGETKVADPKKNPLDNSTDDLLKDLK